MPSVYVKVGKLGQRVVGKRITKEEVDELCASIVAGACTVPEAGTMYGVANHTVRNWLHERGYLSTGRGALGPLRWYDPKVNPELSLMVEEARSKNHAKREAQARKKAEYRRRLKEGTVKHKEPVVQNEDNGVKPTVLPGIVAAEPMPQADEDVLRLKRAADLVAEMRQRLAETQEVLDRRDAHIEAQRASYEAVQQELQDYKQMFREMKDEFIAEREQHEARLEELEKEAAALRADATYGRQQRAINHNLQLNETRKMFDERIVDASTFLHPPKK